MAVGPQGGFDVLVTKPFGHRENRGAVVDEKRSVRVPLRYNYDKPEKPRISRALKKVCFSKNERHTFFICSKNRSSIAEKKNPSS